MVLRQQPRTPFTYSEYSIYVRTTLAPEVAWEITEATENDLTFLVGRNTLFHYVVPILPSVVYDPLQRKDNIIMTPKTVAIQVSVTILAPAIIVAMLVFESASVTQRAFRRPKIHPVVLPTAGRTVEQ